jgi:hypothetical protein
MDRSHPASYAAWDPWNLHFFKEMSDVEPPRGRREDPNCGMISGPLRKFCAAIPAILGIRLGGKTESTPDFRNFAGEIGFIDHRWLPGDSGEILPLFARLRSHPFVEYPNTFRFGNRSEEPLA